MCQGLLAHDLLSCHTNMLHPPVDYIVSQADYQAEGKKVGLLGLDTVRPKVI